MTNDKPRRVARPVEEPKREGKTSRVRVGWRTIGTTIGQFEPESVVDLPADEAAYFVENGLVDLV